MVTVTFFSRWSVQFHGHENVCNELELRKCGRVGSTSVPFSKVHSRTVWFSTPTAILVMLTYVGESSEFRTVALKRVVLVTLKITSVTAKSTGSGVGIVRDAE